MSNDNNKNNMVRATFDIDRDMYERWHKVAKRLKVSRSAMLRQMLDEIIPLLEEQDPQNFIRIALLQSAKFNKEMANLFDSENKKSK